MAKRRATMFGVCSLVAAVAVTAGAQDSLQGFDPATRIYVIQPGDTLWDLSTEAYDDPWKWPRIWENNPDIDNPHAIFPDQQVTMPFPEEPAGTAEAPPEPAPEPLPEPQADLPRPATAPAPDTTPVEPEPPAEIVEPAGDGADVLSDYREEQRTSRLVVEEDPETPDVSSVYVRLGSEGRVTEDYEPDDIVILGSPEERKIYGQLDEVFLSRGEKDGIEVGDRYAVYEQREEIEDPETGEELGRHVVMLGWLEVIRLAEETSVALIKESYTEIEGKNDLVKMDSEVPDVVVPQFADEQMRGEVVWTLNKMKTVAAYQILYTNLGTRDGLEEGDLLGIYRDLGSRRDRRSGEDRELPDYQVGVGVALDVQDKVATVLIVRSVTDIAKGDGIRTLAAK